MTEISVRWDPSHSGARVEERQSRVMVITEFDAGDPEATMYALADEILKYRRAVRLLAKAIGWADAGGPFALIAPGPHWRPQQLNARLWRPLSDQVKRRRRLSSITRAPDAAAGERESTAAG